MTSTIAEPYGRIAPAFPASPDQHLMAEPTRATLRVQSRMLAATRSFLTAQGFQELLPPVIGPVTDPGIRGSKQVDIDFYGHKYKLMTSAILYKQASLMAFEKIFYIAPNVRLEPLETAVTHRHLAEFHQIDVEIRDAGREDAMELAERLVAHVVDEVVREMPGDLELLGRDRDAFREVVQGAFARTTHREATADTVALGHPQDPGAEIDWEGRRSSPRRPAARSSSSTTPRDRGASTTRRTPSAPASSATST